MTKVDKKMQALEDQFYGRKNSNAYKDLYTPKNIESIE